MGQLSASLVVERVYMGESWFLCWIRRGALSSLDGTDSDGVRYFDQAWLRRVADILEDERGNLD